MGLSKIWWWQVFAQFEEEMEKLHEESDDSNDFSQQTPLCMEREKVSGSKYTSSLPPRTPGSSGCGVRGGGGGGTHFGRMGKWHSSDFDAHPGLFMCLLPYLFLFIFVFSQTSV